MDAYEPWYQSTGPSDEDAKQNILNKSFFRYLNNIEKDEDDKYLKAYLNKLYKPNKIPSITYDDIRKDEDWEAKIDNILIEEINNMKIGDSLGSWRGYATFVESKLYENILLR